MRMWMTDPRIMCRQHLLGEHVETHMFVGTLNRGKSMDGYVENDLLEVASLRTRHDTLAKEMKRRGLKHKSPLPKYVCQQMTKAQQAHRITKERSHAELVRRCPLCRKRAAFWAEK